MFGTLLTGGLALFLAFWILMSALEGLGYAVPSRPSVIVPERWAFGARALLWVICVGVLAAIFLPQAVGEERHLSFFHILLALGVVLPVWELLAARVYDDCFVIVNGRADTIRPILIDALSKVFGDMFEDRDMIRSAVKSGDDWQVIAHEREHFIALDPVFRVDMRRRNALEGALRAALKTVKPAGFNERAFWISFLIPLFFAVTYGLIGVVLLQKVAMQPIH